MKQYDEELNHWKGDSTTGCRCRKVASTKEVPIPSPYGRNIVATAV